MIQNEGKKEKKKEEKERERKKKNKNFNVTLINSVERTDSPELDSLLSVGRTRCKVSGQGGGCRKRSNAGFGSVVS